MRNILLVSALLFSFHAFAEVEWVDRYTHCQVVFKDSDITDLGPVIDIHLNNAAVGKWGDSVVAFRGTNDNKPGLWILQGGGASKSSYFAPLPPEITTAEKPAKNKKTGDVTHEWNIETSVDNRPALFIQIVKPAGYGPETVDISSQNFHGYGEADGTEDYEKIHRVDPKSPKPEVVKFQPAVSSEVQTQFLDMLIKRVQKADPGKDEANDFVNTLKLCRNGLKAGDANDTRLLDAISDSMKKYGVTATAAPAAKSPDAKGVQ